jgi:hypothetical protein
LTPTQDYLRTLSAFSCPVPLWRQRMPKQMLEMREPQDRPGPRGVWVRNRQDSKPRRGETEKRE